MDNLFVDCYIHKILRVSPFISEYVAMCNSWTGTIIIDEFQQKVDYDLSVPQKYIDHTFDFYHIDREYSHESISSLVNKGIPALVHIGRDAKLPYVKYDEVFAVDRFGGHVILIEGMNDQNQYHVYDDSPEFYGFIDALVIDQMYRDYGQPLEWLVNPKSIIPGKRDELRYLHQNLEFRCNIDRNFIDNMANLSVEKIDKLNMIFHLRNFAFRYNGLLRIINKLRIEYQINELEPIYLAAKQYITQWNLIISLTYKSKLYKKDEFYDRCMIRFKELLDFDERLFQQMQILKNNILTEIMKNKRG
ncbi:hypothetical protein [Lacrimispora brassicae]